MLSHFKQTQTQTILGTDGFQPVFEGGETEFWVWLWPIFLAGLVRLSPTCLSRHLTAETGFRWQPASKHLSFILYYSGLPSPYPQDFLNYPQFGGHFYTCQIWKWKTEAPLFFVTVTVAVPNRLKPSDLLTHAIAFRIILHSPQNNWHPSPACWAPGCFVSGCVTASGSVWPEL